MRRLPPSLLCLLSQEKLPAAKEGGEPLPEGLLWLLLTGEVRCCLMSHPCVRRSSTLHPARRSGRVPEGK